LKKPGYNYNAWYGIYLCALAMLMPTTGLSIILHPGAGEPNLLTWTDRPVNAVVGRWSSNASFVVVSPKWIVTTRHQNTNPAQVSIGGITYNCIYNSFWMGGQTGNADIRLIRLKNTDGSDPNLAYAGPYTASNEINQNIVMGGYGRGRETILYSRDNPSNPYGYTWGTGVNYNNNTQRWCTNITDGSDIATPSENYPYTSDVITAHFNDQGTIMPKTQYEGAAAEYDSGGGWFMKVNTGTPGHPVWVWKVVGLTRGVAYHGELAVAESWYRDPNTGIILTPDYMDAVRIRSYAAWINGIIAADCPVGDLDDDCDVDTLDLDIFANQWLRTDCASGNNYCGGADFQVSGKVNFVDFAIFAQNYWLED
jgi:hypothetical protein